MSSDVTPALTDLVRQVRAAVTGLTTAASNAVQYAIDAGNALIVARDKTKRGEWGPFLKRCDLGERQAERYMRLARLVEGKPTLKSGFSDLTIEGAIKKLSPPKSAKTTTTTTTAAAPGKPEKATPAPAARCADILEAWLHASPVERQRAVDGIGLWPWLDAVPQIWLPRIRDEINDRLAAAATVDRSAPSTSNDDIPVFLQREPGGHHQVDVDDEAPAAAEPIDAPEAEDEEDEAPRPKRKVKFVEHEMTFGQTIENAFDELSELAEECREIADNASEGLQQTQRIQTFEAAADDLENLEAPTVPDALEKLTIKYFLPKRRYLSRQSRAGDAITMLEACIAALGDKVNDTDAQALNCELQNAADVASSCEFPGMYG